MAVLLMPNDDVSPEAPGELYVGAITSPTAPTMSDHGRLFEDRRPFAALNALCLIGQMWPNDLTAEGVFWIDSQPDICFRLRIVEGVAAYRPAGYWMASRTDAHATPRSLAETITNRDWHPVFGDRIQQIRFTNADADWDHIDDMLRRCLVDSPQAMPETMHN